ncbi:MAG: alpha/beta hydrolase [Chlorobi bacterium]|nr:alpha/beta hydrolase [Chlorobiota bacterium]
MYWVTQGKKLFYRIEGAGLPVVLLHGYLESNEIWQGFDQLLSGQYKLLIPDLPGHGRSDRIDEKQTMDMLADHIHNWLNESGTKKVLMAGHSLGGYVALAYAGRYPGELAGLCLFHSHPYADTDETRNNRKREISLVNEGKKHLIVNTNIPKAFAPGNVSRMKKNVEFAKTIARRTPDEGIVAMLRGMMERPDRSRIFFKPDIPTLWILGKKDQYIPYSKMLGNIPEKTPLKVRVLPLSGHMGFMEEPDLAAHYIRDFMENVLIPGSYSL